MKKWWPLIIKTFVFVLLFCLVDYGLGPVFVYAKDKALEKHPQDQWLKSSYSVEKVNAECIIIGSSTAVHHFVSETIENKTGLSTYNCAQNGCYFLYSCCMVNTILERYSPKIIIMDLNPSSLLDVERKDEYQNMRFLSHYYDNDTVVRKYIDSKGNRNKLLYHTNSYRYNSHAIYTVYPIFIETPTKQGYVPLPPKTHTLDKAKKQIEWDGDWENSRLSELDKTIDNCKKKGVELIVVTSPYYADFDDSAMKKCDEFAEMLGGKSVRYINFLNEAPYNADYSLFKDNAHMNANGAAMMTDSIVSVLNEVIRNEK